MAGTVITYQGFKASSVTARRSRGWSSDISSVVIPVSSFPERFDFTPPSPGDILRPFPRGASSIGSVKGRPKLRPVSHSQATPGVTNRLSFAGFLKLAEATDSGDFELELGPLFVVRVERVKGEDGLAMVAISLADERYFWPRGFLQRWSFNRVRGDGDLAPDSVKESGEPYTMRDVAAYAVSRLPRSPKLSKAPDDWSLKQGPREFAPYSPPMEALAELCQVGGIESPVLRLDGSVALYRSGDGFAGVAQDPGEENSQPFRSELRLSKGLTGQRYVIEPKHPDDYLLIRGGKRIETVVLDDWEPVLEIRGRFYKIDAELINKLTGGRFKDPMQWLHKFLVMPAAYQNAVGISESVSKLLRDQAYRLFRLPGAVVEGKSKPDDAPRPSDAPPVLPRDDDSEGSRARRRSDLVQQEREFNQAVRASGEAEREESGPDDHEAGPNAHLLPLLDRAETQGGKRLPPKVERFGYSVTHRTFDGPGADKSATLTKLTSAMAEIKASIEAQRIKRLKLGTIFDPASNRIGERLDLDGVGDLFEGLEDLLGGAGMSSFIDDLQKQVRQARQVQDLASVNASLASDYEGKYTEAIGIGDEVNGSTDSELYALAKELLAFEQRLKDEAYDIESPLGYLSGLSDLASNPKFKGPLDGLKRRAAEILRKTAKKREKAQQMEAIGGNPANILEARVAHFTKNEAYAVVEIEDRAGALEELRAAGDFEGFAEVSRGQNLKRELTRFVDEGARVYSAAAGVIITSAAAGILERDGLPSPASSFFVPRPVVVTFGATVRPASGASKPAPGKQIKSATGKASQEAPKIKGALEDGPTWYTRAYRRIPGGRSMTIKVEDIPEGEGTVLARPDFVELVPLLGRGNKTTLDRASDEIASGRFSVPEVVRSGTHTIARPIAVNCDGVVSAVQWASRPDGAGIETTVDVGSEVKLNPFQPRTRVRRRANPLPDSAGREGLT